MESTTSTASRVNACCGGSHNGGCTDAVSSPEGVGDSMSRMSLTTSAATPSTTTPTSSSTSAQSSKPLSSTNSTERIPRPQAGNAVKNASTTKSDDYDDEDDIVNADFMTAPSGGMHSYSGAGYDNPNPIVKGQQRGDGEEVEEDEELEPLDDEELQDTRDMIWDLISRIKDPEFNHTLEDLHIVKERDVLVERMTAGQTHVHVTFKPTVPHCSQALTIGLCLAHAVGTSVPGMKYAIGVKEGSHRSESEITKQVNDKERVAAAMEAPALRTLVATLLRGVPGRE